MKIYSTDLTLKKTIKEKIKSDTSSNHKTSAFQVDSIQQLIKKIKESKSQNQVIDLSACVFSTNQEALLTISSIYNEIEDETESVSIILADITTESFSFEFFTQQLQPKRTLTIAIGNASCFIEALSESLEPELCTTALTVKPALQQTPSVTSSVSNQEIPIIDNSSDNESGNDSELASNTTTTNGNPPLTDSENINDKITQSSSSSASLPTHPSSSLNLIPDESVQQALSPKKNKKEKQNASSNKTSAPTRSASEHTFNNITYQSYKEKIEAQIQALFDNFSQYKKDLAAELANISCWNFFHTRKNIKKSFIDGINSRIETAANEGLQAKIDCIRSLAQEAAELKRDDSTKYETTVKGFSSRLATLLATTNELSNELNTAQRSKDFKNNFASLIRELKSYKNTLDDEIIAESSKWFPNDAKNQLKIAKSHFINSLLKHLKYKYSDQLSSIIETKNHIEKVREQNRADFAIIIQGKNSRCKQLIDKIILLANEAEAVQTLMDINSAEPSVGPSHPI